MNDWFRSLAVLGAGFVGVVAFTLGMAIVIVPNSAASSQQTDAPQVGNGVVTYEVEVTGSGDIDDIDISGASGEVRTRVGGTLTVSGDREGTFILTDEAPGGRIGLEGDDGLVFFATSTLAVEQINFGGLSFFPEPDACVITEGEFSPASGVVTVHVLCTDIADVRGTGVVTFEGAIGLSAWLTGIRGDLPPTGGSIDIGDETLVFTYAVLDTGPRPARGGDDPHRLEIYDPEQETILEFTYALETQLIGLSTITRDGVRNPVPDDACAISTREVGLLGPRVALFELSLECPQVDVAGLGSIAIRGSLFVERTEAAN